MRPALPIATEAAQWNDWRWQLSNMITDEAGFARVVELTDDERRGLAASPGMFRVGATPYYASLMDRERADCPIRRQAIPSPAELDIAEGEMVDPLGEDTHAPAPSVFHKYPDRVLLYVVDRCAIYCRHCNRRRLVGGDDPPTSAEIEQGLDYLRRTRRIR